jgi:arabinofuranosyltransferase
MRWTSDDSRAAATPKEDSWPWVGWLAVLGIVVCSIWLISSGAFFVEGRIGFTLFDDAMISMRYAQNLSDHGKLIWSEASGQTEGFTNFGWMLLMAVAYKFFGLYAAPLAVSILALSFLLAGTWVLAESETKFRSLGWPMILCALLGSFSLVFWSIRGFEVALIFFLQACLYVTALTRHKRGMGLVLCMVIFAGVFTRDDFAITTLIFLMLLFAQSLMFKRTEVAPSKQISIFAFILAAVAFKTCMRFFLFGAMLPNTYYLKVEGHNKAVMLLRGFVSTVLDGINYLWPLMLLLLLMLIVSRQGYWRSLIEPPVEWTSHALTLSCIIYSILVGADAWQWSGLANRFVAPVTPFLLMNALLF